MVVILFEYGGGNKGVMGRLSTNSHDFYNSPYHNKGGGGIPIKMVPNFIILREEIFYPIYLCTIHIKFMWSIPYILYIGIYWDLVYSLHYIGNFI